MATHSLQAASFADKTINILDGSFIGQNTKSDL